MGSKLIDRLPKVRGQYRENADLSKINWFNIGGVAEVVFRPADTDDLADFIKKKPQDVPLIVIGVGSNLLVRDGGIEGVVIRLGRGFTDINSDGEIITAGAGALDLNVATFCQQNGIGGLEFFVGIPGTIGGALAMNAGAYDSDTSKVLVKTEAVDENGNIKEFTKDEVNFRYRSHGLKGQWIFTKAVFKGYKDNPETIAAKMRRISEKREETQPIRTRTSGSTFKNPEGKKAWQLIDEAGCRGLKIGGAQVSEMHCNFFINTGNATAEDMEKLGEEVRKRVREKTGIQLEWEVKIIGKKI